MTLTPAEFLAQPYDPEEDADHTAGDRSPLGQPIDQIEHGLPLQLVAEALQSIVTVVRRQEDAVDAAKALYREREMLAEQLDASMERAAAQQRLIDQVLEVVKPSTSKLANSVRAVLQPSAEGTVEPPKDEPPATPVAETPAPVAAVAEQQPQQPAQAFELGPDATVESWREYARILGHGDEKVAGLNRSQIRTLLGVPQPVAPAEVPS